MPKTRLTAAAVERLKPPKAGQVEYFDVHLPAFGLRISYSGTKAWFVTTRVHSRLTRITLGRYPTLSLAEARDAARKVIEQAKAGDDPRQIQAEAQRQKEKERRTTFGGIVELFMERHVERILRPNTAREYRRILQGPDTQDWQSRPINSVSKVEVVDLLHRIEARGAPAAANRALAYLSKFFNWCLEQDYLIANPTTRIRAPTSTRSRERVLTPEELAWVWKGLDGWTSTFAALFKILLLTGQRRAEVGGMRWAELRDLGHDRAVWELPATRTKNRQAHLVPLVPEVQAIFSEIPRIGPLVFTSQSERSVSGFSKAKAALDERIVALRRKSGLAPLSNWTLHDLRRTMVTMMNERLGIAPHIVEAVVNHISGPSKRGVAGVYNRALYLDERRRALQAWAAFVIRQGSDNDR